VVAFSQGEDVDLLAAQDAVLLCGFFAGSWRHGGGGEEKAQLLCYLLFGESRWSVYVIMQSLKHGRRVTSSVVPPDLYSVSMDSHPSGLVTRGPSHACPSAQVSVARSAVFPRNWATFEVLPRVRVDLFCMQITWISLNRNPYLKWNNLFIPKSYQTDPQSARTRRHPPPPPSTTLAVGHFSISGGHHEGVMGIFWVPILGWFLGWFCHTDLATLAQVPAAAPCSQRCAPDRRTVVADIDMRCCTLGNPKYVEIIVI